MVTITFEVAPLCTGASSLFIAGTLPGSPFQWNYQVPPVNPSRCPQCCYKVTSFQNWIETSPVNKESRGWQQCWSWPKTGFCVLLWAVTLLLRSGNSFLATDQDISSHFHAVITKNVRIHCLASRNKFLVHGSLDVTKNDHLAHKISFRLLAFLDPGEPGLFHWGSCCCVSESLPGFLLKRFALNWMQIHCSFLLHPSWKSPDNKHTMSNNRMSLLSA